MTAAPSTGFGFRKAVLIGVSVLGTGAAVTLAVSAQYLAAVCVYALSMCFVALIVLRGVRLASEPAPSVANMRAADTVSDLHGGKLTK